MKNTIVLYHKNCMDGNGAYYAAYKKYASEATYVAVNDRDNLPQEILDLYMQDKNMDNLKSIELYILDFCYDIKIIKKLEEDFKLVVVLDHHVSAKSDIEAAHNHVYGTDKSGAYLAWEYFHPDTPVPLLIQYISDGDIWAHKMPDYEQVLNYIHAPTMLEIINYLDNVRDKLDNNFQEVLAIGDMLMDSRKARVQALMDIKYKINFAGYDVYAVNGSREMRSEVGHELANLSGTFGVYFYFAEGKARISLRSVKDFDVSKIAEIYGGGGHKNASAIDVDFDMQSLFDFSNRQK